MFNWARLIGTNNEDNIMAIDVGSRDIIASISTSTTDEDVFVRRVNKSNGQDILEELTASIATNRDDIAAAIEFDASASGFRILLDSDADLDSVNDLTPSVSRDVQLLTYNSSNENTRNFSIATELDDTAKALNMMPDNNNLIASGETLGEFDGNLKRGVGDVDLFTAI